MGKDLSALEPDVQEMALAFLQACAREGLLLRVTQTRRTWDEQATIYSQGRTAPGRVVSNAPPGYSWHNFGRAFDVCQVGSDPYPDDDDFWQRIGDIGESVGLEWGGRWKRPDRPHFEHHGGMTLAQARLDYLQQSEPEKLA